MVELIALRVIEDMNTLTGAETTPSEPLRWLLHGGPGTGKSHVIKIKKNASSEMCSNGIWVRNTRL